MEQGPHFLYLLWVYTVNQGQGLGPPPAHTLGRDRIIEEAADEASRTGMGQEGRTLGVEGQLVPGPEVGMCPGHGGSREATYRK